MRKLLRSVAKAQLSKAGAAHVNKVIRNGKWRKIVNAYPVNIKTGERMPKDYRGLKRYKRPGRVDHFCYSMKPGRS